MANTNQSGVMDSFFFNISFGLRLTFTILSLAVYLAVAPLLYGYIGDQAYLALIIPAIFSSAFFGLKVSVPVILFSPFLMVLGIYLRNDWAILNLIDITSLVVYSVVCFIASVSIGLQRDLQYRLRVEKGIRKEIETDKEKQTKSLKELDSRLRALFENATIGFYRITLEGSIVMVNTALLKMMKYPFFEIVFQQDMASLYYPHYSIPNFKDRIVKEGKIIGLESEWLRYDGTRIIIYETAWVVLDENGKIEYVDGIISDITGVKHTELALQDNMQKLEKEIAERKKAELTLKESEEKFRDIVEKAGIAITIDDVEGNIKYFNNQLLEVFGYSQDEVAKMKIFDLVHEEDLLKVQKFHFDRMEGLYCPNRYEFKGLTKRGETIYLEIENVTLSENDSIIGTRTYMWDITERKLIEMALVENEDRLRGIFDNSTVGFYRTTPDGRIILVNQTLLSMLKYPSFEAMSIVNLENDPESQNNRMHFKAQLEKEGRIFGRHDKWRKSDGTIAFVRESAWLISDKDGQPQYYEGIVEDITEQVLAEEEFQMIKSELNQTKYEIKLLHSLLPICTSCKKIRQGRDKWVNIHEYIRSNPDGDYGEKLCPDCIEILSDKASQGSSLSEK